ncbi:hypothetical protein E1258_04635 [Micromonospora sp. KC207]|uniref:hypothetical protein n=1 Tax=Micromonospora sp. KC207 TaxID=2530377 RepID=UPI00104494B6|nr:hypothetical protein [Micromonospora sp. KC207]TDC65746.1 hypothetical protein E1258_04635 [Micromonospora sp. KC207]
MEHQEVVGGRRRCGGQLRAADEFEVPGGTGDADHDEVVFAGRGGGRAVDPGISLVRRLTA